MKRTQLLISSFGIALLFATACNKEDRAGAITVRMTDGPADFDEVNVEIEQVKIHYSDLDEGDGGWVDLVTNEGVYDLLTLQNGTTTPLVVGYAVPPGRINQLRLVLGDNNYAVDGGIIYPLELSSQDESGLKINVETKIHHGDEVEVVFDFDAERSIVDEGNGSYKLKPVLRLVSILVP